MLTQQKFHYEASWSRKLLKQMLSWEEKEVFVATLQIVLVEISAITVDCTVIIIRFVTFAFKVKGKRKSKSRLLRKLFS